MWEEKEREPLYHILNVEFSGIQLPTRLNRGTTVHQTGNGPRSTKKTITPKSIKGRFKFGGGGVLLQNAKYMPNSIIFTVQLKGVSRSS